MRTGVRDVITTASARPTNRPSSGKVHGSCARGVAMTLIPDTRHQLCEEFSVFCLRTDVFPHSTRSPVSRTASSNSKADGAFAHPAATVYAGWAVPRSSGDVGSPCWAAHQTRHFRERSRSRSRKCVRCSFGPCRSRYCSHRPPEYAVRIPYAVQKLRQAARGYRQHPATALYAREGRPYVSSRPRTLTSDPLN